MTQQAKAQGDLNQEEAKLAMGASPSNGRAPEVHAQALDVFSLRNHVVEEYKQFATSFTTIHAPDVREQVEAIYSKDRYWPEPLVQINPSYRRTTDVAKLADDGTLDRRCREIFQAKGKPLSLFKHQEQAIALAAGGESFVVTTGTGSGKSYDQAGGSRSPRDQQLRRSAFPRAG